MGKTFDGLFATSQRGHRRRRAPQRRPSTASAATSRERVDASASSTPIRAVDGVAAAAGSHPGLRPARRRRRHGHDRPTASACTIGANWIDDERLNPFAARSAAARRRAPTRSSSTRPPSRTRAGRSATRSACSPRTRTDDVDPRRHRHLRRRRRASPASPWSPPTTPRPRRCSPSPARYDAIVVAADGGDDARRAGGPHRRRPSDPPTSRCLTGDADTADKQADVQGGPELLQHLPAGLRLHRPVRRHVHHLQHLLDRRRPAHAGRWPCCEPSAPAAARCCGRCCSSRSSSACSRRRIGLAAGVGMSFGLRGAARRRRPRDPDGSRSSWPRAPSSPPSWSASS